MSGMRLAMLVLTLSFATAGCKKSAPSTPATPTVDERQACGADEDCAVVETECCDHCNGGAIAAVHQDAAAEVRAQIEAACGPTTCTELACVEEPTAICRSGRCGVSFNGAETFGELPR